MLQHHHDTIQSDPLQSGSLILHIVSIQYILHVHITYFDTYNIFILYLQPNASMTVLLWDGHFELEELPEKSVCTCLLMC